MEQREFTITNRKNFANTLNNHHFFPFFFALAACGRCARGPTAPAGLFAVVAGLPGVTGAPPVVGRDEASRVVAAAADAADAP